MAAAPPSLAGLSAQIADLALSVGSLQAVLHAQTAEVGLIRQQLNNAEIFSTTAINGLFSQVNALELHNNIFENAVQQAISSLAIMVEEIRSGNVGLVPAEMADLLSALARIGGPL